MANVAYICFRILPAALMVFATAGSKAGTLFHYSAEAGETPVQFGFLPQGPVSGSIVSSAGVPGLGESVWEMNVNGSSGGFLFNLDGIAANAVSFRLSANIRALITNPQGGSGVGTVERNRPDGSAAAAHGPNLIFDQWYLVEIEYLNGGDEFSEKWWLINHQTGDQSLVSSGSFPLNGAGSPGSEDFPNSFAFFCANNGSIFLRTQFDNVRFEDLSPPPCGDITGDGVVNFVDITAVLSSWGGAGPLGDANEDGQVNFADLTFVLSNWGGMCP